jgi:hypothetical protein
MKAARDQPQTSLIIWDLYSIYHSHAVLFFSWFHGGLKRAEEVWWVFVGFQVDFLVPHFLRFTIANLVVGFKKRFFPTGSFLLWSFGQQAYQI